MKTRRCIQYPMLNPIGILVVGIALAAPLAAKRTSAPAPSGPPAATAPAATTPDPNESKKKKPAAADEIIVLSPFCVSVAPGGFGATAGGAKDIRFFRDTLARGGFLSPSAITAEGLFSEHDLPVPTVGAEHDVFLLGGEAMTAQLLALPEARYLAQIGFSSGLDPATWRRAPLNLIAVVDHSGSMAGHPLDLVRESLKQVFSQMVEGDQLAIVVYAGEAHVHLDPTPLNPTARETIRRAIEAIDVASATNMEAGLTLGYELAAKTAPDFKGQTRLMQFTDEQPNVGATDRHSFMGLMEAGSLGGIGITVVGVGVQFNADLARRVAAVRGANLFYFANDQEMKRVFHEEFDTMVTELAFDLDLVVAPQPGLKIAGIYGVPGELLEWADDRSLRLRVETIFLSHRRGGIFVALAPENPNLPVPRGAGDRLAEVTLGYEPADLPGAKNVSKLALSLVPPAQASVGLSRGAVLVNEYLGLKAAARALTVENNREAAFRTLQDLVALFRRQSDDTLQTERETVEKFFATTAYLAGHANEAQAMRPESPREQTLWGAWRSEARNAPAAGDQLTLCFLPCGTVLEVDGDGSETSLAELRTGAYAVNQQKLRIEGAGENLEARWSLSGDRLTLQAQQDGKEVREVYRRTKLPEFAPDKSALDETSGLPPRVVAKN